jgi:hypothetical protein
VSGLQRTAPLDSLHPDGRAVLALVLSQGLSYYEIATLLNMDGAAVRARAHAAADRLVGDLAESPPVEARSRIVDYVLGEQSASERARTRMMLGSSPLARDWMAALTEVIAPLMVGRAPARGEDEVEGTPVAVPDAPRTPAARTPAPHIPAPHTPAPHTPTPHTPTPHTPTPQTPTPQTPTPRTPTPVAAGSHSGEVRRSLIIVGALAAAIAAVAGVLALTNSSGSHVVASPSSTSNPAPASRRTAGAARGVRRSHTRRRRTVTVQTLKQLVLQPAGRDRNAVGAGAIVRQNGALLILLQGRGLHPNSHDSYAVWLVNTPGDARLLGFISPAVGADGTFSSGTSLPDDAVRFHEVVVTRETAARPSRPGTTVLRGPLALG